MKTIVSGARGTIGSVLCEYLSWQIGTRLGTNTMIDHMVREMERQGEIRASRNWYPACSFVVDTVLCLRSLVSQQGGVYMINANRKWSFFEIACALAQLHGNSWKVVADDSFVYDQRMIDDRVSLPNLSQRLPLLR